MAIKRGGAVERQVSTLFNVGVVQDLSDGQLLERYATGRGEAAELAFAALVDRHGPMVLRVCRSRLADPHDALDAFQATFLVLIEKARGLWVRDSLGPWLHQVAFRAATRAQSAAARRRLVEQRAAGEHTRESDPPAEPGWERLLHEEINRLPERYRVPIVLCDLEGRTCEEVARKMGRPVGTVKSWRARGRERLRHRLARAGLAPAIGLGGTLAVSTAEAGIAVRALSARIIAGEVPASVGALVKGVLKAMLVKKLSTTAALVCALAFVSFGVGSVAPVAANDPKSPSPPPALDRNHPVTRKQLGDLAFPIEPPPALGRKLPGEAWPLELRDAIRLGLERNMGVQLVVSKDGTFAIALKDHSTERHRFKAEAMAVVRSIEQLYWDLGQQYVRLSATEKAAAIHEEVLNRERATLSAGRGTAADVAEAGQRLEQTRLDIMTRTSDVTTAEGQLRAVLGLGAPDGRRIIPVTPPLEAKVEPDWDACLAAMSANQPDVLIARETPFGPAPAQEPTDVEQTIHEAAHAMGKSFREIGDFYKQFELAKKLRTAAKDRLAAQRAYYDEGRITIDRYLDAASQYASRVAQEAAFKARYNVALIGLEEAKGTLLEHDGITVVEPPPADEPATAETHDAQPPAPVYEPKPAPPTASAEGRTIAFQATVNIGGLPIEIHGSLTVGPAARTTDSARPSAPTSTQAVEKP